MPRFAFATLAYILSLALSTLAGPVPRNVEATPIPSSVVAAVDAAAPVSEAFHFGDDGPKLLHVRPRKIISFVYKT